MRKSERKQAKPEGPGDEMRELHEHAAAQAALFDVPGHQEPAGSDDDRIEEIKH